ncbi:hypothetical protein ACIA8G_35545 [Lentzea sp. NPDC051213]|uniref:hypothetical protein n=1 Tax=Lentzea sp. NPDC051213 TaxID=3364126 RepID=UPI0037B5E76A
MDHAFENVGNWTLYHGFQHELALLGRDHFSVLHTTLPDGNGGATRRPRLRPHSPNWSSSPGW